MAYDIDYDFEFEEDEFGDPMMPKGVKRDGNLCVLPNGRYLAPGSYITEDGGFLIYEPRELSPFADIPSQFK